MAEPTVIVEPHVQARLDNLEKQLFQLASKSHRTLFRQNEEASPLAKLESTIRLLDSEFQQFRGTDPKRLVDVLVTQYQSNFRQEIEERLATRASEEELLQFQKDIFRIENFTRETQVNVFSLKSKLESLGADLESRFTEQRWSALESSLAKAAARQQEELQKEIRSQTKQQEEQVDTKLKGVQSLLTLLEKEVRIQYGPEMLQEHMRTLEQSLATTVRTSLADATQQLTTKVANYEGQAQNLRQLVLEAVADVKQELQGAALQARFQAYETRLAEQEERYKSLGQQYTALEAHLKRQTAAAQERQSDLYQELEQTQAHIKELDVKATQAQQQVVVTCTKWLKDREQSFDTKYGQTESIVTSLQQKAILLEEELGIAFQQRKAYEETWKDQYSALQKTLEEKFTAWTDDKTVYLTGRVIDLTKQLQGTIQLTKLHQRRVDELLSEENIRGFVTAIETKVRTTQDEWAQRRNTEISLKFDSYGKQFDVAYTQLETDRQQAQRDRDELMSILKRDYKEEVNKYLVQVISKIDKLSGKLQQDITLKIQQVEQLKTEIQQVGELYVQQTNSAITSEKYSEFQEALKKEVRKTFTDNQTALNLKHMEHTKEATHILQLVKDQELRLTTRLNSIFSTETITNYIRNIERRVLKQTEEWRTQIHKALSSELATLRIESLKRSIVQDTTVIPLQYIPNQSSNQSSNSTKLYESLTKCFYTAIYGTPGQALDSLGLMKPPPGWDAFCFTNQPELQANGWTIIYLDVEQATSVLQAKFIKWNSHKILEDYDVAVWLDAYLVPSSSSANLLQQWIPRAYMAKAAIVHRKHDTRNCVWDECKAVVDSNRDTPEHVDALKRRLTAVNMPHQYGLFDTNMMIRFHKLKACQDISDAIWTSLKIDTHRDQLIVTPIYYTKGFKSYATVSLQQAFDRSGTHIRNSAV